ncbi:MAG: hypothetical protein ACYS30_04160 [Planctomycetota bacterium]|jgi:hypothetical protein
MFSRLAIIALIFACLYAPAVGAVEQEQWPLPGRNKIPKDAKLFLEVSAEPDTKCSIHIRGNTVKAKEGDVRLIAPLPKRRVFIYVELVEGRGGVFVYQNPCKKNDYEAIITVHDVGAGRGKHKARAYFSQTRPKESPFVNLIRVPDVPKPHYTEKGQFWGPTASKAVPRSDDNQDGRFWGEKEGRIRSLVDRATEPAFRWKGEVDEYAVLAFDGESLTLFDCGLANSRTVTEKTGEHEQNIEGQYLILSECSGPGRVRIIQPMNVKGVKKEFLIELDDRGFNGVSRYGLTGYLVPKARVDEFYRPKKSFEERWVRAKEAESKGRMSDAAAHWAWIATHTNDEQTRLWAIEKFCMLQPYPGPAPSPTENETLTNYQTKEPLEILLGKNMVLAWPKEYTARAPTKWRFLAELDACMEWLKDWTGRDEVRRRKKRMISRFRLDQSGTSLYYHFRLHISRGWMTFPPSHGGHGHELSHGFIHFPAIETSGRFGEGLTQVARTSYCYFMGFSKDTYRRDALYNLLKWYMHSEGTVLDAPGYGGPAALYFVLMDHFCRMPDGNPDWHKFTKLFNVARQAEGRVDENTSEQDRWRLCFEVCEKAFGKKAREVLQGLGLPPSEENQ